MVAFLPIGRAQQKGTAGFPGALFRVRLMGLAALFVALVVSNGCVAEEPPQSPTGSCAPPPERALESATVGYVNDGDTVRLANGDRVRLVGIDTPELGRDGAADEPYAAEARQALRALLAESRNRVTVVDATEGEDRYGRRLSYLYLPDGRSVQARLLEQGMAMAVFVAPNLELADCLVAHEKRARQDERGIWSLSAYAPGLPSAAGIPETVQGAAIVRGRVVSVGDSRRHVWLNLEGRVAVRIDKADLARFPGWDFEALEGEELRVRGWIVHHSNRYQDWFIPVDSAHALERLD
ncbi:thermonuclease family protein [Guyparkeria halophila]|uniref:Thermonuclease family protein n=1 Tax=Guyparkeria halophila TaxID=47960 RepID=A0ABZ0YX58_9GAMM|nr:thermonuclease family protein [Guyparkeria halophila]WQH16738.1 thermonuclease family protein [Guyparkeria halophila]